MKTCSYCGRESEDHIVHCGECGTQLASEASQPSGFETDPLLALAEKQKRSGALWCIGGIAITTFTFMAASSGGIYVVTWGAIIYGAERYIQASRIIAKRRRELKEATQDGEVEAMGSSAR